jgi:hypothetical protein
VHINIVYVLEDKFPIYDYNVDDIDENDNIDNDGCEDEKEHF